MRAAFVSLALVLGCERGVPKNPPDRVSISAPDAATTASTSPTPAIARFADERALDESATIKTRAAVNDAPNGGAFVAWLPVDAQVTKVAVRKDDVLVRFDTDGGAPTLGWTRAAAFAPPIILACVSKCFGPCMRGTCLAHSAVEGMGCDTDDDCVPGLACRTFPVGPEQAAGGILDIRECVRGCRTDRQCKDPGDTWSTSYHCGAAKDTRYGTVCSRYAGTSVEGALCEWPSDCAFPLWCDGTCRQQCLRSSPTCGPGEVCAPGPGSRAFGLCVTPKALGDRCTGKSECAPDESKVYSRWCCPASQGAPKTCVDRMTECHW